MEILMTARIRQIERAVERSGKIPVSAFLLPKGNNMLAVRRHEDLLLQLLTASDMPRCPAALDGRSPENGALAECIPFSNTASR